MIRAIGVVFVFVILLPAFTAAQEPKVKLPAVKPSAAQPPPPMQKQPPARPPAVDPSARLPAVTRDADTPFSWGFTLPYASLGHALGANLGTGPWTVASMDCGGEEIWEASGTADNVGTQAYVVEPEEWQAGFVGGYRRDFQSADCDPHPFTPTVRVEASLR